MRSAFGLVGGFVAALGAACAALACAKSGPTGTTPPRSLVPAASSAEVDRANLEVTPNGVSLDSQMLADAEGYLVRRRLARVDELFRSLKERRRAAEARRVPVTQQVLNVAAGASPELSLSAMVTAAFAGYERIHANSGNFEFDAVYAVPTTKPPALRSIVTVTKLGEYLDLSWQTEAPCDVAPRGARIKSAALSNWLGLTCSRLPKPCVNAVVLSVGTDDSFDDVAKILHAFQAHADKLVFSVSRWLRRPAGSTEGSECGHPVLFEDPVSPPPFVRDVLHQASASVRACYEEGLQRDRWLQGVVAVGFTVGKDGRISAMRSLDAPDELGDVFWPSGEAAVTTLSDRGVVDCILGAYQRLEFPPLPGRPLKVVYPMKFSYEQK